MQAITHNPIEGRAELKPAGTVQDTSGYTIFSEGDIGAAHAMAHRMLDEGRIAEGHARLSAWLEDREGTGSEWIHIQFHMIVLELELGLVDEAFARFKQHILPAAASTTDALTDAPALAWRLYLVADSPDLFPWEPIRRRAESRIELHDDLWVDLHNALALAGARDLAALDRWLEIRALRAATPRDNLLLEVVEGLRAYAAGDYAEASARLTATVPHIPEIGGSHAQNGLFKQIETSSWQKLESSGSSQRVALAA